MLLFEKALIFSLENELFWKPIRTIKIGNSSDWLFCFLELSVLDKKLWWFWHDDESNDKRYQSHNYAYLLLPEDVSSVMLVSIRYQY
jgi:hypothetical protein